MKKQTNPLKTQCDKALQDLRTAGISVSQWARDNGYTRDVVAAVVYGRSACRHGQAHEVAVALGIKAGQVVQPGSFRPRVKAVDAADWDGVERRSGKDRRKTVQPAPVSPPKA